MLIKKQNVQTETISSLKKSRNVSREKWITREKVEHWDTGYKNSAK